MHACRRYIGKINEKIHSIKLRERPRLINTFKKKFIVQKEAI